MSGKLVVCPGVGERIQLSFPEGLVRFRTEVPVYIGWINYGGHMDNSAYLAVCHEVRLRFLRELGVSEEDLGDGRTGLIMTEAVVQYLAEVFWGEVLVVEVAPVVRLPLQVFFYYRMIRRSDSKVCGLVRTLLVGFDYGRKRVCGLPLDFVGRLGG